MPFARYLGDPLFFAEYRKGRPSDAPLVLVHGAGGTHLHWPPQVRRLADTDVFALDLPGHGKSGGAASSAIPEKAEAVLALLDHLRAGRAVLAGHSMGSAIALTTALLHPERVAGLVLVGAGARLRVAPARLESLQRDFPAAVAEIVAATFGPGASEQLRRLAQRRMLEVDPGVLRGDWEACNTFDVMDRLREITAPALVLSGEADVMTPPKYGRYLAEHLPRARLCLVPGAGHMVMLEQPEVVVAAIREFMADTPGTSDQSSVVSHQ